MDFKHHKLTLHLMIASSEIAITNVYAPNSLDTSFFQELVSWVHQGPETFHLLGGNLTL